MARTNHTQCDDASHAVMQDCPDCGVKVGRLHKPHCDVERCPSCGNQLLSCFDCGAAAKRTRRMPWSGEWPGDAECREFGWFAKFTKAGWQECEADDPEAEPDLNKLGAPHAKWDVDAQRWVRD